MKRTYDRPTEDSKPALLFLDDDTLIRGNVKVQFVELGEGNEGDYDPEDPEDEELLRFDILGWVEKHDPDENLKWTFDDWDTDEAGWKPFRDGSYCTQVPTTATPEQRRRLLEVLMDNVYEEASQRHSVKKLGERLSWIGLHWLEESLGVLPAEEEGA